MPSRQEIFQGIYMLTIIYKIIEIYHAKKKSNYAVLVLNVKRIRAIVKVYKTLSCQNNVAIFPSKETRMT
jgi:hypothetical protein